MISRRSKDLPRSTEAERAVAGALTLDPQAFSRVRELGITSADFTDSQARMVFEAAYGLERAGQIIEPLTLEAQIRTHANGLALDLPQIIALGDSCGSLALVEHYAQMVRQKSLERELLQLAHNVAENVRLGESPAEDQLTQLRRKVAHLASLAKPKEAPEQIATSVHPMEVIRSGALGRPMAVYSTGIPGLDERLGGGLREATMTLLMAPTNQGKSCLAVKIAWHLQLSLPVLYVSTEIDKAEMVARLVGHVTRHHHSDVLERLVGLEAAAGALEGCRIRTLHFDDETLLQAPLERIEQEAILIRQRTGVAPAVILDYLQHVADLLLLAGDAVRASVNRIVASLKAQCHRLGSPFLAVSSVGRGYYGAARKTSGLDESEDPRDWLAAAKESGNIEYAFQNVIYLDASDEPDQLGDIPMRAIVCKTKSKAGPGFVGLRFDRSTEVFSDDQSAMTAFGESAKERKAGKARDELKGRILEAVRKRRDTPLSQNDLQATLGCKRDRLAPALAELLEAGQLVSQPSKKLTDRVAKNGQPVLISYTGLVLPDGS